MIMHMVVVVEKSSSFKQAPRHDLKDLYAEELLNGLPMFYRSTVSTEQKYLGTDISLAADFSRRTRSIATLSPTCWKYDWLR